MVFILEFEALKLYFLCCYTNFSNFFLETFSCKSFVKAIIIRTAHITSQTHLFITQLFMLSGLEFSKRFFDFKYSLLLFITISSMTTPSSLALTTSDFLFSDLCSVNTTSTKTCYNDWISRPGTCYEDSCCVSFETATSWYYRTAQASQVVFSSMGLVVLTVYALKYSSKHMLPSNVRVLVNIILILMFTHSIDMIIFHVSHW